jgi:hypothetical protein
MGNKLFGGFDIGVGGRRTRAATYILKAMKRTGAATDILKALRRTGAATYNYILKERKKEGGLGAA